MKNYIYIGLFCFLFSLDSAAQEWGALFTSQDFTELESKLGDDVTVKLDSGKKITNRAKAIKELENKLTAFGPVSINSKHRGSSNKKENYYIGELVNSSGAKMRVFLHLENTADGKKICDIKLREL